MTRMMGDQTRLRYFSCTTRTEKVTGGIDISACHEPRRGCETALRGLASARTGIALAPDPFQREFFPWPVEPHLTPHPRTGSL